MTGEQILREAHRMQVDGATANLVRELVEARRIIDRALADVQAPQGRRPVCTSALRNLSTVVSEVVRYGGELNALVEVKPLVGYGRVGGELTPDGRE